MSIIYLFAPSLVQRADYELATSPLCSATAFYFSAKKHNEAVAKTKIDQMNNKTVKEALQNKQAHDFEDGMQYYSALEAGCSITSDTTTI
ncbi:MAG: hypothetical protein WA958_01630 [Tunicatimonas sp.]